MDKTNLLKTAEILRKSKTYSQSEYIYEDEDDHPCGTPACIAGHIAYHFDKSFSKNLPVEEDFSDWLSYRDHLIQYAESCYDIGQDFLGLTDAEARKLFSGIPDLTWPNGYGDDGNPTAEEAARLLEDLANGKVTLV